MITLREISYYYKHDNRPTLDNLNLTIRDGEFVTVLGKSGCGKTTLANLIAGYLLDYSGIILINNKRVYKPGRNRLLVNQENDLFTWLTVWGNMKIVKNDEREIIKLLKLVGLAHVKDYYINSLSGGMKKRLSLARALLANPDFLILDEPFASLDHHMKTELYLALNLIFLKTKKTILFVTHDIDEAILLSDRIIVLGKEPTTITREIVINFPHPRKNEILNTKKFTTIKKMVKSSYT